MSAEESVHDGNTNTKPRVFLSYSIKDKEKAGEIRKRLEKFGIHVFVSHDDIRAGEKWNKVIIEQIRERECFVPLISENYHGANYTEQEFGMAMAMDKKIIPITCDGTNPVGFGAAYQCRRLEPETSIRELLSSIINTSLGHEYMDTMIDIMIDKILYSNSYVEANRNASEPFQWIREGYVLTSQQRDRIDQAFGTNSQVNGSAVMQNLIEYLDGQEE